MSKPEKPEPLRVWAVVCRDGTHNAHRTEYDRAAYWTREGAESHAEIFDKEKCGPHRVVMLEERR